MTALAHRATDLDQTGPRTIDGHITAVDERRIGVDPETLPVGAAALLTLAAAVGMFWSMHQGAGTTGFAFITLLVTMFATVALLVRYNTRKQA